MPNQTLTWTQPNTGKPEYWEAQHGFWITPVRLYHYRANCSTTAYQLFNGESPLGRYDTLDEAKAAAEPQHDEGTQPFHRYLQEEP